MKKLLSLIGAAAISTTGVSSAAMALQLKTITDQQLEKDSNFDIDALKNAYNALSEVEKIEISQEMMNLSKLNINEVKATLDNSNIIFIKNNKDTIEKMFILYSSLIQVSSSLVSAQIEVEWTKLNEFINLGFGNSNDYAPYAYSYGPENWWEIWDWGLRIDFPEGSINIMRVIKLLMSLYNGIDFTPFRQLLMSGRNLFDYLVNITKHGDDKISVLYNLVIKVDSEFKKSGIPFRQDIYDVLNKFKVLLKPLQDSKLGFLKNVIKAQIEQQLGMSLEAVSEMYLGSLDLAIGLTDSVNRILRRIGDSLPSFVWDFIMNVIKDIANEMVAADWNHKGVYIKFQQYLYPLGFKSR